MCTLAILRRPGVYEHLDTLAESLASGLRAEAARVDVPLTVNRVGSMLTPFFTTGQVTDYNTARLADTARYGRFFRALLDRGVYFPPSQFEAAFLSLSHSENDISATLQAAAQAFAAARG